MFNTKILSGKINQEGYGTWNAKKKKIWINATAHMNHAAGKESVATVSHITCKTGNCLPAVSRKIRKEHITDLLNILPNWYPNAGYKKA